MNLNADLDLKDKVVPGFDLSSLVASGFDLNLFERRFCTLLVRINLT